MDDLPRIQLHPLLDPPSQDIHMRQSSLVQSILIPGRASRSTTVGAGTVKDDMLVPDISFICGIRTHWLRIGISVGRV
jgi:hypothetical protein